MLEFIYFCFWTFVVNYASTTIKDSTLSKSIYKNNVYIVVNDDDDDELYLEFVEDDWSWFTRF